MYDLFQQQCVLSIFLAVIRFFYYMYISLHKDNITVELDLTLLVSFVT